MNGFVVVLKESSPGVVSFPRIQDPGLERLMRGIAQSAAFLGGGLTSSLMYLRAGGGTVLSFTIDRSEAEVFQSEAAAQAAIDRIPSTVRPGGLSVRPLD